MPKFHVSVTGSIRILYWDQYTLDVTLEKLYRIREMFFLFVVVFFFFENMYISRDLWAVIGMIIPIL